MKYFFVSLIMMAFAKVAMAQPQFELSRNIYRSPYANGEEYTVRQDHNTHNPLGRYDLRASGDDDCNTHRIVAAAAGIVRNIVEDNDTSCASGCGAFNNYVWLQHANGEWSKYTHFRRNSVAVNEGDTVCAGTFLGFECSIGATSPANWRHLHFEVRLPNDPDNPPISEAGGFLDSVDGAHLIPVICGITDNYFIKDAVHTAVSCSCSVVNETHNNLSIGNGEVEITLASNNIRAGTNVIFSNGGNGFFRAGNRVTLTAGFRASPGSYFRASVGSCGTTPFPGGCN